MSHYLNHPLGMAPTTSTAFLLSSSTPSISPASSSTTFPFNFIFPAKALSTVNFSANPLHAVSAATSGKDHVLGRRGLVLSLTATLPLLLPFYECTAAKAAEEYELMKEEIRKVVTKGKAAGVLRLVFHDAGTFQIDDNSGGMDGSIVYELDRPENKGLKSPFKACPFLTSYIDILEKAKSEVDAVNPVSWADMIAVAGAEAVSICGGPTIQVPLGRLDAKEPDPEGKLPEESLDALGLKQSFQTKGLSTQELVALSGAHTIGNKGFGNPTVFDNTYFKILLDKPSSGSMIGLPSDRALAKGDECLSWITKYAEDQNTFFEDFKTAYLKLVNSGARWKSL
ncbi:putative L-ascorbate peroxidase 6 isoform X1 [Pyrus x bretschneideri]|uniref:putative L-ascorbate peroxidase 6 isoform X1 n=1 Tax=Pyrus x bretschneideri TaxID=225117 RepID=UPI00202F0590|nr:putative L-ascorbate peroxidase 6 isoform X1 [Pyrus x bretschneideri]